ncbi:MAG: hypothetical protein RI947_891 [Candidatus Parcubacteria bacterium]|jgi:hypothetical protein
MNDDASAKKEAVSIISEVLGNDTGVLFSLYFKKRHLEEILTTLAELLTDYMGEKKAKEISENIYKKYHQAYP